MRPEVKEAFDKMTEYLMFPNQTEKLQLALEALSSEVCNDLNEFNQSLLHYAIVMQLPRELIRILLEKGADVEKEGLPYLFIVLEGYGVANNRVEYCKEITQLLLDYQANPNQLYVTELIDGFYVQPSLTAAVKYVRSPLIAAVHNGDARLVEMLLDAGADINRGSFKKMGQTIKIVETPLTLAVRQNAVEIVALLLGRGANTEIALTGIRFSNADLYSKEELSSTAFSIAFQNMQQATVTKSQESAEIILNLLLAFGAKAVLPNANRNDNQDEPNPAVVAIEKKFPMSCIKLLVKNTDMKGSGWQPLFFAAYNGNIEAAEWLVSLEEESEYDLAWMSSLKGKMNNAEDGVVYLSKNPNAYYMKGMQQAKFLPKEMDLTNKKAILAIVLEEQIQESPLKM